MAGRLLTGLPLAFGAQWLLDVEMSLLATLFYLAAAALLLTAGSGAIWTRPQWRGPRPLGRVAAGLLSGLVALAAVNAFVVDLEQPSAVFWWVHLGSIAAAVLVVARFGPLRTPEPAPASPAELSRRTHLGLVATIGSAAVAFRLYELTSLPEGVWFDEANSGVIARRILDEGVRPLWVAEIYKAAAHHAYLIAGLSKLGFGAISSIRLVSALLGLVAVAGAYIVGRELWGTIGGVAAMALVGLGRWPVTLSRIGMFNIATPACLLAGLALILVGIRRDRPVLRLVGGAVLGLGLAFHSSMVAGLLGLSILLVLTVLASGLGWRALGLPLAGVALAAAPIVGVAIREPDLYTARQSEVSIFNQDVDNGAGAVFDNATKVVQALHVEGDANGRHNLPREPLLDPVAGALVAGGAVLAVRSISRPAAGGLLAWVVVGLAPAAITISSEVPNALRMIGALPAVILLGAAALVAGVRAVPARAAPATLLCTAVALGGWTVKDYFNDWRNDPTVWAAHSAGETIAARESSSRTADSEVVAAARFQFSVVMGLLGPGTVDRTVLDDEVYPLVLSGDEDAVLLIDPEAGALVAEHRLRYGDAAVTEHRRGSLLAATVIELTAEEIRSRQGLVAEYSSADGDVTFAGPERIPGEHAGQVPAPARLRWEGLLLVEHFGEHRFDFPGLSGVSIRIDGADVPSTTVLHKGPHHVVIEADVVGDGPVGLAWHLPDTPDDSPPVAIPPSTLWRADDGVRGLFGTSRAGVDGGGAVSRSRLDAAVDFFLGQHDAERPRLTRWDGFLDVPAEGLYTLGFESSAERRLWIDGGLVLTADGREAQELFLAEGLHRVEIEVVDRYAATDVRFVWAPPGEELHTVSSTVLVPPWVPSPEEIAAAEASAVTASFVDVDLTSVGPADVADAVAVAADAGFIVVGSSGGDVVIGADGGSTTVDVGAEIADVAVGPDGSTYVLDPQGRVLEVGSGDVRTVLSDGLIGRARGIDVTDAGTILVAITPGSAVVELHPDGSEARRFDLGEGSQPVDVLWLNDGRFIVTDATGPTTRLVAGDVTVWQAPTPFSPSDLGAHLTGLDDRVFRSDPERSEVVELTAEGAVAVTYRLRYNGDPVRPVGIASTIDGQILVADVNSGLILSFPAR